VRAKGGVRQVNLMIANVNPKLDDPAWSLSAGARGERRHPLLAHHGVRRQAGDRVAGKAAERPFENTKFFLANFLEPSSTSSPGASRAPPRCAW